MLTQLLERFWFLVIFGILVLAIAALEVAATRVAPAAESNLESQARGSAPQFVALRSLRADR